MGAVLYRLGLFTARHRWVVLGAWLLAVIAIGLVVRTAGAETSNNLELPGTDSQAANDLLAEGFPPQQNGANPIVFKSEHGKVSDGPYKQAIKDSRQAILEIDYVYNAPSPFTQKGQAQLSKDKQTAFLPVLLKIPNAEVSEGKARRVLNAAEPGQAAGLDVAAGGQVGSSSRSRRPSPARSSGCWRRP